MCYCPLEMRSTLEASTWSFTMNLRWVFAKICPVKSADGLSDRVKVYCPILRSSANFEDGIAMNFSQNTSKSADGSKWNVKSSQHQHQIRRWIWDEFSGICHNYKLWGGEPVEVTDFIGSTSLGLVRPENFSPLSWQTNIYENIAHLRPLARSFMRTPELERSVLSKYI